MRTLLLILFIVVAAVVGIPMIPLKTAVSFVQPERFGLVVRDADGNLRLGHLYGVQFGKVSFGDVITKMSLANLAWGRVEIDVEGNDPVSQLRGSFSSGFGGTGVEGLMLAVPVGGAAMMPPSTLMVDGLSARFQLGQCNEASGTVRASLSGSSITGGMPDALSGPAVCRDGKLAFDMASESGNEQEVITILSPKSYRVRAVIKSANPALAAQLQAAGFAAGADGFVYEGERAL